jgi:hypothetical protein
MKTEFTPAPWEVKNTADIFTRLGAPDAFGTNAPSNDGWHIADCDMGGLQLDEVRANARLISAAPEMFSLLEIAACPQCDGSGAYYDGQGDVCQCQWCYERREVIAKARGES